MAHEVLFWQQTGRQHFRTVIPQFDEFIAIDWSGAVGRYDGIAVAICGRGRSAPALISPNGVRWTRSGIAEWLKHRLDAHKRLLIGFDFAFGFPFESKVGYLGGLAPGVDDIFAFWSLLESKSCADPDFGCVRFISDADHEQLFWKTGPKPKHWIERKRRTEFACAEATATRPDTVYKLVHSKQVGKASITGIRVLHHVRSNKRDCVSVWPFEKIRRSAMVEIYPTLFRKVATGSIAKLRSLQDLNRALSQLMSRPFFCRRSLTDHETDALVSAAGLRWISRDPSVWTPQELKSSVVQREGWIFAVGSRLAAKESGCELLSFSHKIDPSK